MERPTGRIQNGHDNGAKPRPQKTEPEARRAQGVKPARSSLKELQMMLYLEKTEVGAMDSLLTRSDLSEEIKIKIAKARRQKHDAIGIVEAIVEEEIEQRRPKLAAQRESSQRRSLDRQLAALHEMRKTQCDSPGTQSGDGRSSASGEGASAERRPSRSAELKPGDMDKPRRKSSESSSPRSLSVGQRAHLRASSTPQVEGSCSTEPSTSSTAQRSSSSRLSIRTVEATRASTLPGGLIRHSSLPPRYPSTSALTNKGSGSPASQGSSSRTTSSSREGRRSRDGDGVAKSVVFDLQESTRNGGSDSGAGSGAGPGPGAGGSGDFSRFASVAEILAKRSSKKPPKEDGDNEGRRSQSARNGKA